MIFDENFDRALWLLVASNKKDSEKICEFINFIPDYIYNDIQKKLTEYYDCSKKVKKNIIYDGCLVGNDGYEYYIVVKVRSDKLYFKVLRWKENIERIEEQYNLILKEMYIDYLDNMKFGDIKGIGKYSYEINKINDDGMDTEEYTRVYNLNKLAFGFVITSFKKRVPKKVKYVNLFKNIPKEIYIDDFSTEENINGLIKKRKRNID